MGLFRRRAQVSAAVLQIYFIGGPRQKKCVGKTNTLSGGVRRSEYACYVWEEYITAHEARYLKF